MTEENTRQDRSLSDTGLESGMLALTIRRARATVAAEAAAVPDETFASFLAAENKRYLEANDREVRRQAEVRDPDLIVRLENYRRDKMTDAECETYGMEQMLADIMTNVFIRSHFRKDPVRQSLHENSQIAWLQRRIPDLVKLPAGKGGTYFYEGRLSTVHPRPAAASKTLDVWSAATQTYGVLKYSTTAGGAQDNQYNDVKHFIREAVRYLTEGGVETFIMWLDGPYYTTKKYETLRDMVPPDFKERIRVEPV
jgi:hypothetical protein